MGKLPYLNFSGPVDMAGSSRCWTSQAFVKESGCFVTLGSLPDLRLPVKGGSIDGTGPSRTRYISQTEVRTTEVGPLPYTLDLETTYLSTSGLDPSPQ